MKIGIVGAGVSGLIAADRLHSHHEVTLLEAGPYAGGHTNTVEIEIDGQTLPVDTGFIVFNEHTYPNFCRLLDELGVASAETSMSFGVSDPVTGFEYGTTGLGSWLARRRNLLDPRLYRLLREILGFFRQANAALDGRGVPLEQLTLGELLDRGGFSETFRRFYIVPMTAAVWSAPPDTALQFPARTLLTFLRNHGLLSASGAPTWRYVRGGSRRYVDALLRRFSGTLHLSTPVQRIARRADGCELQLRSGERLHFDRVIVATHSDQALAMLEAPTVAEREVLGAIAYQPNEAILHTDIRVLPRHRGAWSSWNYRLHADSSRPATLSYYMNRLQALPTRQPVCVTLNDTASIDPDRILKRIDYAHPVYTRRTVDAQARWSELCPPGSSIAYAGAYWFYGFHEDGVRSGLRAAECVDA